MRAGPPAGDTGLDPRTQAPFLGLLIEHPGEEGETSSERLRQLARLTVELVDFLRSRTCVVDFWRNTYRQNALRGEVIQFLDNNDLFDYDKQPAVADEIVELARSLHTRLCP